ncbi:hypothetical protein TWF569_010660 [Orbilia oligospora]|uniref:Uncharacterized protein n=1 Tax=Orbilia oligospora TaxID=2813651 RepID=A0A7C8NMH3_ORBOL|nr:hypothetical protein TWF102_008658 [Orbilia oligospora]KAF3100565.1 hypothetical protein TWF706_006122 [Orbilia oligospora]KAF3101397.1 hypothetical protein TWF103_007969 [Orbilia oligospora]KAF3155042.1 hypothetical protein TWF569_010660 [Orbilia oligospora]
MRYYFLGTPFNKFRGSVPYRITGPSFHLEIAIKDSLVRRLSGWNFSEGRRPAIGECSSGCTHHTVSAFRQAETAPFLFCFTKRQVDVGVGSRFWALGQLRTEHQ